MDETIVQEKSKIKMKHFNHDLGVFLLYALPISYMAIIMAVLVHEILGHGLFTLLLGGKFLGFTIIADGMGWASIDVTGMSRGALTVILLSGAFLTDLSAIVLFAFSYKFRENNIMSITFLFFALSFLMDGVPYYFWDVIYQGGIGDASNILKLYPNEGLRIGIILFNGFLGIAGIVLFNFLFMDRAAVWYGSIQTRESFAEKMTGGDFQNEITDAKDYSSIDKKLRKNRIVFATVIFLIQALAWLIFDWSKLIPVPGVSFVPSITAIILTGIALVSYLVLNSKKANQVPGRKTVVWKVPIITAWCLCILVITIIILICQNGVVF